MLRGINIRLYPTQQQTEYINRLVGCCRFIYNRTLEWRKQVYETEQRSVSSKEFSEFIQTIKNDNTFLREVHSKVLQQSLRDLDAAYQNFFKGVRNGKKVGFPQFKSKHKHKESCRFPADAFIGVKGNRLSLIKALKDMHFKCSRRDERILNRFQSDVRSVTLTRNADGTYTASVLMNLPEKDKLPISQNAVGIDLGVKTFAVTSDGVEYPTLNNAWLDRRIKRLQRLMSKKEKNSRRYDKVRVSLAKLHSKKHNRMVWYHHDIVNALISDNQVICVESLNVKGMLKNHHLARVIQNQGFYNFLRILSYKCEMYGRSLLEVGRFYASSKTCSVCGYKNDTLSLSDRQWHCPECGTHHDRDLNASMNIRNEGLRLLEEHKVGLSSPELTHVDCPPVDDRGVSLLRSSDRLNREKNVIS